MRSLAFAAAVLASPLVVHAQHTASLAFIGSGPYAVPAGSYGVGWAWTSRVNPQVPVYVFNNNNQIGMFAVRDAVQQKAFKANLEKWCDKHGMYVARATSQGSSFRVDVEPRPQYEAEKQSPSDTAQKPPADSKYRAVRKPDPKPTAEQSAQLADFNSRIEMVKRRIEEHPELDSLYDVLASLEKKRDMLVDEIYPPAVQVAKGSQSNAGQGAKGSQSK